MHIIISMIIRVQCAQKCGYALYTTKCDFHIFKKSRMCRHFFLHHFYSAVELFECYEENVKVGGTVRNRRGERRRENTPFLVRLPLKVMSDFFNRLSSSSETPPSISTSSTVLSWKQPCVALICLDFY